MKSSSIFLLEGESKSNPKDKTFVVLNLLRLLLSPLLPNFLEDKKRSDPISKNLSRNPLSSTSTTSEGYRTTSTGDL